MYESIETVVLLPACFELPGFKKPYMGVTAAFGGEKGKNIKNCTILSKL